MINHHEPGVTLTITTCNRYDYFCKTVDSFFNNCKDAYKIKRIIVNDDRSAPHERDRMLERYPNFEFNWLSCGHPESLIHLFNNVHTEYFFHLEDDRPMLCELDLIGACINVMRESNIDSFICGLRIGSESGSCIRAVIDHYVHEYKPDGKAYSAWNLGNTSWPGFYLAPGMHKTMSVQTVGYEDVPEHERSFALRYNEAGFKVAFNCGPEIFGDIGKTSAYDIMQSPR